MSWQDDLGKIRLLGPDEPEFNETVRRVWEKIDTLEGTIHSSIDVIGAINTRIDKLEASIDKMLEQWLTDWSR